jgi:hypothetical protein
MVHMLKMTTHFIKNSFTHLLTIITLLFSLYIFMATMDTHDVFNSDQLSIAYLYKDLFQHHGHLKDWTLSNVNYLFPDTVIGFFYNMIFSDFKIALFLTDCTLLVLYYLAMVALGALVCGEKNKNIFRLFTLFSLILANGHLRQQEIFSPLLVSHFSSTVTIYLVELYLIVRYLTEQKWIHYYLLMSILYLVSLSDPLAMLIIVGSSFFAFAGLYQAVNIDKKKIIKNMLTALTVTAILSILTIKLHLFNLYIGHTHIQFIVSIKTILSLYRIFQEYSQNNILVILLTSLYFIFTTLLFFMLFLKNKTAYLIDSLGIPILFILLSTGGCITLLILSSILLDQTILIPGFNGLRHFNTLILIPTFLGLPILLVNYTRAGNLSNKYYIYIISALLGYVLIQSAHKQIGPFIHYYPSLTKCLDDYYQTHQLNGKNGLSDYWDAHLNSMLSKNDLTIIAATPDYRPYRWMSTQHDYINKTFNFILLRMDDNALIHRQIVLKKWGEPEAILTCPDDRMFLIYTYKKGFSFPRSD